MKKKRAESAIPPQIKIVGCPCLISPKSFSMNNEPAPMFDITLRFFIFNLLLSKDYPIG